jgi:hypothetical protein
LRIAAQKGGKFRKGTFVAQVVDNRLHLTADTPHFILADFVDLLRCHVGRRLLAYREAIHLFSLRQLPNSNLSGRSRKVFLNKKFFKPPKSRNDSRFDNVRR